MRIGIICPSEIAIRRFLPALKESDCFEFAGVAVASREEFQGGTEEVLQNERRKAQAFIDMAGGRVFEGYRNIIEAEDVDAVYLPLPPGLHYRWAREALLAGKHILVEKPFTTSLKDTEDLLSLAAEKGLAVHENYMFVFHDQIQAVNEVIRSGEIGDVRLYRIAFGFPMRAQNDFRYNKALGGGALLDCGGYTLKYASLLLGPTARMEYAHANGIDGFSVDMYGSTALVNEDGVTAQVAFGMDQNYKCELEVWGSKGTVSTNRILTAPVGFVPDMTVRKGNEEEVRPLPADDAFRKSIQHFRTCIDNTATRQARYENIRRQAALVDDFKRLANLS